MGERNESRENARASGKAVRGRGGPLSRVLPRLTSLAQIGELARRLIILLLWKWRCEQNIMVFQFVAFL